MKRVAWFSAALLVAACGDDNGGGGDPDANVPDVDSDVQDVDADTGGDSDISGVTTAYSQDAEENWVEEGPANWDCLGDPDSAQATENEITVSGQVTEFNGGDVEGVEVSAYDSTDFTADPVAGPVPAEDPDPNDEVDELLYEGLTLPAGVTRVTFLVTTNEPLKSFSLGQTFEDPTVETFERDLSVVSESTAGLLAGAALQGPRTQELGIVAGDLIDCDGNTVMHAIGALSTTSGELTPYENAERTFYFGGLLPVRTNTETQEDGRILIPEIEPSDTPLYVQVWGYPDQASLDNEELVLLAELETTIVADGLITAPLEPLTGEAQ